MKGNVLAKIAIVTDSTCDWDFPEYARRNVTMVPLKICFGDQTFKDQYEIGTEEFYDRMIAAENLPTTSQPSPHEFAQVFEQLAQQGYEGVLCMHIALPLSGTVQSAEIAASTAPIPVKVIDPGHTTASLGLIVDAACDARDAGVESLDELYDRMVAYCRKTRIVLTPATLDNLVRGGRFPKEAAEQLGLLNVRMILTLDETGAVVPFDKAKGFKGAVARYVSFVKEYAAENAPVRVRFVHTRALDSVEKLKAALAEAGVEYIDAGTTSVGATVATHLGMGAFVLAIAPEKA